MLEEQATRTSQERATRFFTHDQPIIVDNSPDTLVNNSITLALDGDRSSSYREIEPGHYFALGHTVKFVTIDGRRCDFVPASGRCTIRLSGVHDTAGDDSPVTIVSAELGITITFDVRHYPRDAGATGNRKRHQAGERRLRYLNITNDETHEEHACELPMHTTPFRIVVEDRDPEDID